MQITSADAAKLNIGINNGLSENNTYKSETGSIFTTYEFYDGTEFKEFGEPEVIIVDKTDTPFAPKISEFFGKFIRNSNDDTQDGVIGATAQHSNGDCWLLSGVNALSYTQEGKKIISDTLKAGKDGTIVHLKGAGDYFISNKAINQAMGSDYYSSGDEDMICFELAVEQAISDTANGIYYASPDAPFYIPDENSKSSKTHKASTDGGHSSELFYLITGKTSENYCSADDIKTVLKRVEENNMTDIATSFSVDAKINVKDVNGKKVKLPGTHAYAVKEVKDDKITFTNPWNSGEDITLNIDTFVNDVCSSLTICDLSESNEPQQLLTPVSDTSVSTDENGVRKETLKDKNGNTLMVREYEDEALIGELKYDADGNIIIKNKYMYDYEGNMIVSNEKTFDKNNILKQGHTFSYNDDGDVYFETINYFHGPDDQLSQTTQIIYDKKNNPKMSIYLYDENKEIKYARYEYTEKNKKIVEYDTDGDGIIDETEEEEI